MPARRKTTRPKAAKKRSTRRSGTKKGAAKKGAAKKGGARKSAAKSSAAKTAREAGEIRMLVRTAKVSTAAQVARAVGAVAGRRVKAEPLYPEKRKSEQIEFLVRIPATTPVEAQPAFAFELAHRVRDESEGLVAYAEPDVPQRPSVAFPDVVTRSPGAVDEANIAGDVVGNLCNEKRTPPADHYWHLREMHVPQAWELSVASGAPTRGEGVRIGHLDTGWTTHPELRPSLDLNGQHDFVDDDKNAEDPLAKGNPFHGSRTGSVIASAFDGLLPGSTEPFPLELSGVAPRAKLVPVRVVKSVIVFFNGDVARGIRHAAERDCHVISMSLGGVAGGSLRDAVKHAVERNVIVCAAAGNCVGLVVQPASYPESIAVAATNSSNRPWKGSSRGSAVDIAAPGAQVWTAARPTPNDPRAVDQGEGTSFAVAGVAGIAALWLAHHGRATLLKAYAASGVKLQYVFKHCLQRSARDIGLPKGDFGAGFADAEATLRCPLPDPSQVATLATRAIAARDSFDAVAADLLGPVPPVMGNLALAGLRGAESGAERDLLVQEFAQICFDHPNAHKAYQRGLVLAATTGGALGDDPSALLDAGGIAKYASPRLRSRLTHR